MKVRTAAKGSNKINKWDRTYSCLCNQGYIALNDKLHFTHMLKEAYIHSTNIPTATDSMYYLKVASN